MKKKLSLYTFVIILITLGSLTFLYLNSAYKIDDISGKYVTGHASITIEKISGDTYHVTGEAVWEGLNAKQGQVNNGVIEGKITVSDNEAQYIDGNCEIMFEFNGTTMRAEDNYRCGGLNVTFSGEYKKQ